MHVCEKCGYVFRDKCDLSRHMSRKVSCSPCKTSENSCVITHLDTVPGVSCEVKKDLICKWCNKTFSRRWCVTRHEPTCKSKVGNETKNVTPVGTVINCNVGTVIINNNITINLPGEESIEHIDPTEYCGILTQVYEKYKVKKDPMCAAIDTIEKLNDSIDSNPENHNIRITNINNPYCYVYNGLEWKLEPKKDALNKRIKDVSDRSYNLLNVPNNKQFASRLGIYNDLKTKVDVLSTDGINAKFNATEKKHMDDMLLRMKSNVHQNTIKDKHSESVQYLE